MEVIFEFCGCVFSDFILFIFLRINRSCLLLVCGVEFIIFFLLMKLVNFKLKCVLSRFLL